MKKKSVKNKIYEYLVITRKYLSIAGFKKMCQIVSHEVPLWISLGRWSAVHCHGRFSNLGTVCPPWNSNFVFTWDTVYILLPIAVEVCEVESLWSTTEGALYYNIARQAFPSCYSVVSLWASLRAIVIQHCQASFSQLLWFCVRGRVSEHL